MGHFFHSHLWFFWPHPKTRLRLVIGFLPQNFTTVFVWVCCEREWNGSKIVGHSQIAKIGIHQSICWKPHYISRVPNCEECRLQRLSAVLRLLLPFVHILRLLKMERPRKQIPHKFQSSPYLGAFQFFVFWARKPRMYQSGHWSLLKIESFEDLLVPCFWWYCNSSMEFGACIPHSQQRI